MMNSLFAKILVSFWSALIIFGGLTLWTTSQYLQSIRLEANSTHPKVALLKYIAQAKVIARTQNVVTLRAWLVELDKNELIPYLLLDQQGKDLIHRPVPLHIKLRILKYESRLNKNQGKPPKQVRKDRRPIVVKGMRYRLLQDYGGVNLNRVLNRPRVIAIPLLIAALISGIVCYLLAHYLTWPIKQLHVATNKLAMGDLDARVSQNFGKRKDEIVELAHDFDTMAEKLSILVNSHKQLLRDASHELRSPLARLQVALGLARQRSDDKLNKELDRIEREAERLNELIGKLLSVARLESESTNINRELILLDKLLESIADDGAYEAHSINRDVTITNNVAASIEGNEVLLHSALENVIRNAIHYTKENTSVEISMVFDSDKSDWVNISIRDYGPGIPDDMLSKIFEPFVRVSEARDRMSGGYGLGLAIASRSIRLHGGEIVAKNHASKGAIVVISLPTHKEAADN